MWFLLIWMVLLLPACAQQISNDEPAINFSDSVKIVRELLKSDSLIKILDDAKPEQLDFLINNFSPAQIAFESEVLNCTDRVILYCYHLFSDQNILMRLPQKYPGHKIVIIDANQFPFLVNDMEVTTYPTLVIFNQRAEVERFEEKWVEDLLLA